MISLFLIVSIIILLISCYLSERIDSDICGAISVVLVIIVFFLFVGEVCVVTDYSNLAKIEAEIEVYEQENIRIKEDIALFYNYEFEEALYAEESKVQEQINHYYENIEKITALKIEKTKFSSTRWLLFFGN